MARRCRGYHPVGRYVLLVFMFGFAAGGDAIRALSFYKGQRPHATSADAATDIAMSVIYIVGAVVFGYVISNNHFVQPEDTQE